MAEDNLDSGEEVRGAYAETRVIKSSIIYKKNEVLQLLQDHHYYGSFGSYPNELMPKITSNLITLYRLIRPMLTPKMKSEKYQEYKDKITPTMTKLIEEKSYLIEDKDLYQVVDLIVDFIHFVGITDLTVEDIYKTKGLASDEF